MPNGKPRIVVIDDDLADRTLASVDAELRTLLGDVTDPVFETIWTRAQATGLVPAADTLIAAKRMRRAQQADFIQFVLGDITLEQANAPIFSRYVRPTLNDIEGRRQWFKAVEGCFPPTDFVIEKHSAQPDPATLVGSACVLLDLVGVARGDPFETATSFITKVADECSKRGVSLPCFMLVSSQFVTYQTRRNEFRAKANISASGLRLVEKSELTSSTGTDALRLVWTQMGDEQSVARSLRTLCKALEGGQESLRKDLNTHVWNLDCDALLRIYRAAKEDSDPFEEHLLEFLARRLTWLVYEDAEVRKALTSIATSLAERVPADARIKRFYSAIGEDRRSLMELIGSYHWAPLHDQPDLAAVTEEQLKSDATRALPFGAVLTEGEAAVGSKVLVHITQPCDLGHMKGQNSLKFVAGELKKLNPETEIKPDQSQDFAPGLRVGDDYLTLEVDLNSALSGPANEMLGRLKTGRYRVIARLRHDIARRVLQKYAAHITRPDIPRFAYVAEVNARVFVKTRSITPAAEFPQEALGNGAGAQGIMETTSKKNGDKLDSHITLRGDYVTAVACWVRETLLNSGGLTDSPSVETIAMALRDGIKASNPSNPTPISPSLQIVAYEADARLSNKVANNPPVGEAIITIAFTKI